MGHSNIQKKIKRLETPVILRFKARGNDWGYNYVTDVLESTLHKCI